MTLGMAFRIVDGDRFRWSLGVEGLAMLASGSHLAYPATYLDLTLGTLLEVQFGPHALRIGGSIDRLIGKGGQPGVRVGVLTTGFELPLNVSKVLTLMPALEASLVTDKFSLQSLRSSLELGFAQLLFLRGGWVPLGEEEISSPFSVGAGLRLGPVALDYAVRMPRNTGFTSHSLTATLLFQPVKKKKG